MNRRSFQRLVAFFCINLFLLGSVAVWAQGETLTNPGFEEPFEDQGGDPARIVAQGWTAWNLTAPEGSPTFMNQQPEYLPARPDTTRIRSGENAQFITSFFATYTAGLYQQVDVAEGAELTFSVYAYVWSSAFDNVDVSNEDGELVVQVGIDPNGGADPESGDIVWSSATMLYDSWNQYTVSATAAGSTVTVWIRGTAGVPTKNNNLYLDDASLTVAGEEPAATATSTSTTVPPTETSTATVVAPTNTATATRVEDGGIIVDTPTQETLPTATSTEAATETPPPTETAVPTDTAVPTETAIPTETPLPTETATSGPTSTPVPSATPTLRPTLDPTTFRSTVTYTVLPGDTVQRIAGLYGSTSDAIIQANDLGSTALIFVGQQLIVPVRLPPVPTLGASPTGVALEPTTTPIVISTLPPQQPTAAPQTVSYQVQVGDTLSAIAARFNTSVPVLSQLNGIVNPDRILLGQILRIPTEPVLVATAIPQPTATQIANVPQSYTVQPGDTLFRISIQFNVPIAQLINLNGIANPNQIVAGQVLRLQ